MTFLRIVVPVLDEAETLAARLDRLAPWRRAGVEVVVVDGGSTDASWAIARPRADRLLLAPRGRASQMNAGARDARADVLLFLHADTELPPDAVQRVQEACRAGAVWGRFDVRIAGAHPLLRVVSAGMNLRSRLTGIATGDQALFVRRELFERVVGFPELPLMEDVALTAALRRIAPPACIRSRAATSARRWERHGVLRTIVLMWSLRARHALGADPQALADRYGYARRPPTASAAVAVLAKAPLPGYAKTRLAPAIGVLAAARAQRRFTVDTVQAACAAALGPVQLWCAPDPRHRLFRALARRTAVELLPQPRGDLGERLAAAAGRHFDRTPELPLLLVGTDCPVLAPGHLQQAARLLREADAVIIPASDGGYVLLGLRRPLPGVFRGIAWSTAQVLAQTRERLAEAGASWREMPPLWDVDEPADWQRWQDLQGSNA